MTEQDRDTLTRLVKEDPAGVLAAIREHPSVTPGERLYLIQAEALIRYAQELETLDESKHQYEIELQSHMGMRPVWMT